MFVLWLQNKMNRTLFGVTHARWIMLLFAQVLLGALSASIRNSLNLEWNVNSIRAAVAQAETWGPLFYIALLMFRFAVLVPSSILLTGAGICFGPVAGTLYATVGLTLSALLKFGLANIVGRDFLLRQLSAKWCSATAVGDRRSTATGLAIICAYPLGPNHVFQIAAILAGIPFSRYVIAVASGGALRSAAFAFFW